MKSPLLIQTVFVFFLFLVPRPALAVKVEKVITPGGLEAWLVKDHTNPIITVRFAFKGGAALDPKNKSGLANFVASTMDEGAGKLDAKSFQQTLEDHAIRMHFNAGIDNFGGNLQTLVRHYQKAFALLQMALTVPRFDVEPVERIRAQILVGLKQDSETPIRVASKTLRKVLYGDHPYGKSVKGTPNSVKAITTKDLQAFMKRRLGRNNLVISVVGDILPKKLITVLDATFGSLPSKAADWQLAPRQANTEGQTIIIDKNIPQSTIIFADQGVLRNDPDFYAAHIMNHILGGGGFTSRLFSEIREKRGLAYSISSGLSPRRASATLVGGAGTANARVKETLNIIKREWEKMARHGVTENELNDAKTYLTGAYPLRFSESGRIAHMLLGIQLAGLDLDYVRNRNGLIEAITRKDIAQVAKKLLDSNRLVTVIVGRPKGMLRSQ